jgi:hypothetical protein
VNFFWIVLFLFFSLAVEGGAPYLMMIVKIQDEIVHQHVAQKAD